MRIKGLTPTTGKPLKHSEVIGREREVREMTEILYRQGISLSAMRRFGKSALLIKLEQEMKGKNDFLPIYVQVEDVKNCQTFVEKLYVAFKERKLIKKNSLITLEKGFEKITERFKKLSVPGLVSVELNERNYVWASQLDLLLTQIVEENPNQIIVISLDEFSIMLDEMEDQGEACELIGKLRSIAHTSPFKEWIRFIYCGSIGIDLVLEKLKKAGNTIGQPLNHMYHFNLGTV